MQNWQVLVSVWVLQCGVKKKKIDMFICSKEGECKSKKAQEDFIVKRKRQTIRIRC